MITPNLIAYAALFGWPLVVIFLFRTRPIQEALIWSLLGGLLLLPSALEVKIPMVPAFDKTSVPNLTALLMCILIVRSQVAKQRLPQRGKPVIAGAPTSRRVTKKTNDDVIQAKFKDPLIYKIVVAVLLISPVFTALANSDPIVVGPRFIPGLRLYDAVSILIGLVTMIAPFFLAKRFLATPESHALLLKALCFAGLAYSLPMLFESRMSPQLHTWLYGYFPHSFAQHVRADGYRPVVFFRHGLLLGMFIAMTVIAAIALWRHEKGNPKTYLWFLAAIWMSIILLFAKSLGPLTLTILIAPAVMFATIRFQIVLAAVVAAVILIYPAMRGAGWVPIDTIYNLALSVSEDRAQSLKFRLDNEELLLERANERPLTGWGSWGRPEIHDPYTGETTSTWDGAWIIFIATFGWLGYLARFGLLAMPLLLLGFKRRRLGLNQATSGLALILAFNLIDLIPNASLTPIIFLISGALMGRYSYVPETVEEEEPEVVPEKPALKVRKPRTARSYNEV